MAYSYDRTAAKSRLRPGDHMVDLRIPGRRYEEGDEPNVSYSLTRVRRGAPTFFGVIRVYDEEPSGSYERQLLDAASKALGVPLQWKDGKDWEPNKYVTGWVRRIEVEGELGVRRDKELAAEMDKVVLDVIYGMYDAWKAGRGRGEPQITGAFIRGYLDQGQAPDAFRDADRRRQGSMVHAAVGRLLRKGKIGRSHGIGGYNYEPNEDWWRKHRS